MTDLNSNKIIDFKSFQGVLTESELYQIPGVKPTWNGGYEVEISDPSSESDDADRSGNIFIAKRNDKSIALCYLKKSGDESEYLWIPLEALRLSNPEDGKTIIKLDPAKKWILNSENKERVEDFIEDFADSVESRKLLGSDFMRRNAQDDVELLMDVLNVPGSIKSFESSGENIWDATLDDGRVIEIVKRNPDDLICTFRVYDSNNSSLPLLTIKNQSKSPKTIFHHPSLGEIEVDQAITSLRNQNPYVRYLINKCLGQETSSDQSDLYDFFKKVINEKGLKSEEAKSIMKLLEDFMDSKDFL